MDFDQPSEKQISLIHKICYKLALGKPPEFEFKLEASYWIKEHIDEYRKAFFVESLFRSALRQSARSMRRESRGYIDEERFLYDEPYY